jgi:hypothetical protein
LCSHHFKLTEYAFKFFFQVARQIMVNFSFQISHFVLVLIAIYVVHNEARKITTQTSSANRLNVTENVNPEDDKLLKSSEVNAPSTAVVATQQDARESKYSYFYVGRWTWHIPLWFTLWFSFYVFFNVIRSIYGHTVN